MIVKAIKELLPNAKFIITGNFSFNDITWQDERPQPTEEEINVKIQELEAAEPMKILREERNRKLAETDWWVLPDRTASQEQKDYRQALRDLPSVTAEPQLDEEGNLTNVTWPTKPT